MQKTQPPMIKRGTVLSIGTVISIENDCVKLDFKGNEVTASFTAIEKIFDERRKVV